MRLVQLLTVFHNLLETGGKFAGRYPHNIMQVGVCQQRPVLRLIFKEENACSQIYVDPNSVKKFLQVPAGRMRPAGRSLPTPSLSTSESFICLAQSCYSYSTGSICDRIFVSLNIDVQNFSSLYE